MSYKRLGDYIVEKVEFNEGNKYDLLQGVSNNKYFQKAKTNTIGVDLSKYRVAHYNQFVFNRATTRNGDKISIALRKGESCIVSPSYRIFEVKDENILHPDYLLMWFKRPEFDRYARFKSHGSAHEFFDMDEMNEVELPIPSIEKQHEIVAQYQAVENKIKVNEQICEKLEATAQTLYKQWFVDFEFLNENGKPYKSSGGSMIFNKELEKEIPEGWEVGTIGDLFTFQRGHDLPSQDRIFGEFPIFASTGIAEYHNEYKIDRPTIITGRSGSLGELFYYDKPCWPLNTSLYIVEFKKGLPFYSLYFLQTVNLKELGAGSAVPTLNRNDIHLLEKEIPDYKLIKLFEAKIILINNQKENFIEESQKLTQLQSLLLSRLATLEG